MRRRTYRITLGEPREADRNPFDRIRVEVGDPDFSIRTETQWVCQALAHTAAESGGRTIMKIELLGAEP